MEVINSYRPIINLIQGVILFSTTVLLQKFHKKQVKFIKKLPRTVSLYFTKPETLRFIPQPDQRLFLTDLPTDILLYLNEFFITEGSFKEQLEISKSWRNFLHTSAKMSERLKRQTISYRLNAQYSREFLYNPYYRDRLITMIANKQHQLELQYSNLYVFPGDDRLDHALQFLNHVHVLEILHSNINDISVFNHVHTLKIFDCPNIHDISCLKNVKHLSIFNCENISRGYDVIQCVSLLYVNHFASLLPRFSTHLQELVIVQCLGLVEIVGLCNMRVLTIMECPNVYTIAQIERVTSLCIVNCENLQSLHTLEHINEIGIVRCDRLNTIDFKLLDDVKTVVIDSCPSITSLTVNVLFTNLSIRNLDNLQFLVVEVPYSIMSFHGYDEHLTIQYEKDIAFLAVPYNERAFPSFTGSAGVGGVKLFYPRREKLKKSIFLGVIEEKIMKALEDEEDQETKSK